MALTFTKHLPCASSLNTLNSQQADCEVGTNITLIHRWRKGLTKIQDPRQSGRAKIRTQTFLTPKESYSFLNLPPAMMLSYTFIQTFIKHFPFDTEGSGYA
jgi:hypothetical protein